MNNITTENQTRVITIRKDVFKKIDTEGNFFFFIHKDYPCVLLRQPISLHWCGYVGIQSEHPFYKLDYHDENIQNLDVHGGITYASSGIGYTGLTELPCLANFWWLGFDAYHLFDYHAVPCEIPFFLKNEYRDKEYMKKECEKLVDQLVIRKKIVDQLKYKR